MNLMIKEFPLIIFFFLQTVNHQLQAEIKREKEALLGQLAVTDILEEYELISESLLSAWFNCDDLEYKPQPSLLAQPLCEHKLFSPRKFHLLKCIRKESVSRIVYVYTVTGVHSFRFGHCRLDRNM